MEAGNALAQKYDVQNALQVILEFNPAEDPVGTKPIAKRAARAKISSGDLEAHSRTPVRSRAPSVATPAGSPTRIITAKQQEPTPIYREFVRERQFTLPTTLTKRMFDEDNARKEFFDAVYSRKRSKTVDSITPVENEVKIPDPIKVTDSYQFDDHKTLLMHIFVNEDSDYNSALFEQMLNSYGREIETLQLELGPKKGTLLHWAAAYSRVKLAKLFICKGIKINVADENGVTPLMEALSTTRSFANQTMDDLLNLLGPSLFAADKHGRTALHYVNDLSKFRSKQKVSTYYMECITRYIEDTRMATNSPLIAFIDAQDHEMNTALHLACYNRNHKNAALLIRLGASKLIENQKKETPKSLSAHDFRLINLMVSFR